MITSVAFIAAGCAAFWGSWKYRQSVLDFFGRAVETEAEVVRVVASSTGDHSYRNFFPVVRFETTTGETVEGKTRNSVKKRKLDAEKTITVHYDPEDTRDIRLGMNVDMRLSYVLIILGCVLVAMGVNGVLNS